MLLPRSSLVVNWLCDADKNPKNSRIQDGELEELVDITLDGELEELVC